jgi:predicted amidohydrolase
MQTLTVSLVQTSLFWEDKSSNLEMLSKKISGITEKTEVVILPEMFSTGFSLNPEGLAETMDGPTVKWMKKIAAEKKCILTGSVIIKEAGGPEPLFFKPLLCFQPPGPYW